MTVGSDRLKRGFAKMQKGGVIMDVVNVEQAKIAEKAGSVAVMALERVPADIRAMGGVARMADPEKVREIIEATTIPVMAKCRIGHFAEAQILQEVGADMVDESEVLTPADEMNHIVKKDFTVPFVCGARNLGEALRRINEGAAMIRTKGEPGTGNVVEAVRHTRIINAEIKKIRESYELGCDEFLANKAKEFRVPVELVNQVGKLGRLPVVNFAAGGIATPADASLMMQLGCDGIFVGSGIFKADNPRKMAKAIVEATSNYDNPEMLKNLSSGLGEAMKGEEIHKLELRMQDRKG
ncbi:MAG: pyridoxal 5'-phosphate synthase lyase subunit PdxS [archaeon]